MIKLSLLITPDDAPAYRSSLETSVLRVMLDNFTPGKVLIALVRPHHPHNFVLEVV